MEIERLGEALGDHVTNDSPLGARHCGRQPFSDRFDFHAEDAGVELDIETEQDRGVDQDRPPASSLRTADGLLAVDHQGVRELIEKTDR